ncbi:hypothetical protein ISN44_As06g046220 [Arabidopsis suecica]|uniref:GDSL esterase/lipase 1-like n=1 Tax=Arabidopsis suecica TaxID=45249 RepID=A0A8T2CJD7_ARASU|nr:hypothetical protein ISN44_As06g046220 [Arabidopsis suecica]
MENSRSPSIIFFAYTTIVLIGSINCRDNNNNLVTNQSALFVFGDSVFDAGNNNYIDTLPSFRSNYWPYGQTTFKFPTGRVSDGRTIPDFIAEYAWLPLIPPYLQPSNGQNQFTYGVSFASAGAGALAGTFPGMVIDLKTQLNNFRKVENVLRSKLGEEDGKRRYIYVDFVVGNTTAVIKEVYKIGGRKFGFLNMGAYDCAPALLIIDQTKIGSCFKPVTELINLHNEKLRNGLRRLERELSGFKYAFHDYHTSLSERMNNPSKYGFKEGKKACCGTGPLRGINTCGGRMGVSQSYELCENVTDYLFFDPFHLTEKVHQQIAELIWSGSTNERHRTL